MAESGIAKVFMHGRSQAVRLPRALRVSGDRVRVRRGANGFLLGTDLEARFAELDRFADVPFAEHGLAQSRLPDIKRL